MSRPALLCAAAAWLWSTTAIAANRSADSPAPLPNIVLIFADDLGYADVGCFAGDGPSHTPHIDRLAREGIRFNQFYTAQPVCSASRAALLTGCYANRIGIHGALGPGARHGIHDDETTLAEIVKQKGYATAAVGKWHLGHHPQFLPTRHGFDEYFGLPYSNDMWPHHPEAKAGTYPPLPLIENDRAIDPDVTSDDQPTLTTRYTERAVRFIERNHDRPFFLYVAHSMPHVPLFVSDKFAGKSPRGIHGDVLMEVDWSVGEILAALERHKIDGNTLVIFTSDNGPWLSYGNHAGSAGTLREGKGTVFEGGVRVPFVARWPARIAPGQTQSEPAMTIDLVPTVARLIDARLPDRPIDGLDIWPLLAGRRGATNPHAAYFFYYNQGELHAVRSGRWKLMLPHTARSMAGQTPGKDGRPGRYKPLAVGLELYDLQSDPSETTNVAAHYPDVVGRLQVLADTARADLGDALTKRAGSGTRSAGRLAE